MKLTGNTVLITGGGTGIGRGLAEALHQRGNQILITGRREAPLKETCDANPGMKFLTLDVTSAEAIGDFADRVKRDFPELNVLINNAGIMKSEDVKSGNASTAEQTVTTNLLGPIRLTSALLPQLMSRDAATVMMVTSGLAFLPLAFTPTYCATKAAIHSYALSLRYQLRDTPVGVIELAPPYVQTELTGEHQATDPNAMPLDEFVSEVMSLLESDPSASEILVQRVRPLYDAPASGEFNQRFNGLNDQMAARFT